MRHAKSQKNVTNKQKSKTDKRPASQIIQMLEFVDKNFK